MGTYNPTDLRENALEDRAEHTLEASLDSNSHGLTDSMSDSKLSLCRPAESCLIK